MAVPLGNLHNLDTLGYHVDYLEIRGMLGSFILEQTYIPLVNIIYDDANRDEVCSEN